MPAERLTDRAHARGESADGGGRSPVFASRAAGVVGGDGCAASGLAPGKDTADATGRDESCTQG